MHRGGAGRRANHARGAPDDDETLLSFVRWTIEERGCCPFFTFCIEREAEPGALWVRITGPDGAKQVLDDELTAIGAIPLTRENR